jgi:hypothetical protein
MYNGIQVEKGYKLDVVISKEKVTISVYVGDSLMIKINTTTKVIENSEVGPFIYASYAHKGVIVIEQSDTSTHSIDDVYRYVITIVAGAVEVNPVETSLTFTEVGSESFSEVYQHINNNYYTFDTEVIVTTFEEEAKDTEDDKHIVINTENTSEKDEIQDVIDEFENQFKNNKAFRTVSLVLGTILCIFILWYIYKIFRIFFRWLKG